MFVDAVRAAKRSNLMRYQTGAAIYDRRGNLLSIGWSHSAHMKRVHVTSPNSVHAERHAIERLTPDQRLLAQRIVIATLSGNTNRNIVCGNPCTNCARRIRKLPNIEEIFATQGGV